MTRCLDELLLCLGLKIGDGDTALPFGRLQIDISK
jgi:hypothetical protein